MPLHLSPCTWQLLCSIHVTCSCMDVISISQRIWMVTSSPTLCTSVTLMHRNTICIYNYEYGTVSLSPMQHEQCCGNSWCSIVLGCLSFMAVLEVPWRLHMPSETYIMRARVGDPQNNLVAPGCVSYPGGIPYHPHHPNASKRQP